MSDPNDNITVREYDWRSLVVLYDPDHYKADVAYEFSNGRKFLSTDKSDSGVYE